MQPLKQSVWKQSLKATSATAKELVGTIMEDRQGNRYAYARAGATALAVGKATVSATIDSDVVNCAVAAASAGARSLTVTVTSTTIAEDYFRGGYVQVNDATGEGAQYAISRSTAVAAGTSIIIALAEPLVVALDATSEVTLVHSKYMGTVVSTTDTLQATGVPLVAVAATYYYWSQIGGMANVLINGTPADGSALCIGTTTAGSLDVYQIASGTLVLDRQPMALLSGTVGVSGEYKPVTLGIN